jgi:hypothetical protein
MRSLLTKALSYQKCFLSIKGYLSNRNRNSILA